jgi:pteridine reductase
MTGNDRPLALITGGANRLGKAFALSLAHQGYAILLHYHDSENAAQETGAEIREMGLPVYLIKADLSAKEGIRSVMDQLDAIPHKISVLVNSAGIMLKNEVRSISFEEWDRTFNLNLRAPFFITQQIAGRMSAGLIVNITDAGEGRNWLSHPAYIISKNALSSATCILAKALAPEIRVNAIAPGLVLPSDKITSTEWGKLINHLPMKRPVMLKDITSALEFLLQNVSITGQTITVDAGYSLI